jgi:predicted metal-dependent phosphoesterase TrpH
VGGAAVFAEMIALEHMRRELARKGEGEKAAEIAKLMRERTEEFRRERANAARELRRELEAALSGGDFARAVRTANRLNELGSG